MKIGFVVVLYQTPHWEIEKLKKNIVSLGLMDYKIYWIDNTDRDSGYAAGVNEGMRMGIKDNIDYFVLCNPDIIFDKNFGKKLLDGKEQFDIWGGAMAQNGTIYYGGEIDPRRGSGGLITKKPDNRFSKVDFVSGACMIVSKQVIEKIGYPDESYFMYYEDVDYCVRAGKAGLKVGIDSQLIYTHFESSNENPNKKWWLMQNRLKFVLSQGSLKQKLSELIYLPKTIFGFANLIFRERTLLANFTSMSFSSVINRSLTFLLFINLVRLLPPVQYGQYALVWAHVAILMPFLDLGTTTYSLVNLPTKKENSFVDVFSLRIVLSAIVFASTLFLAFLFHYEVHIIGYIALTGAAIFASSASGSFLILSSLKQKLNLSSLVSVLFQIVVITTLTLSLFLTHGVGFLFVLTCVLYLIYTAINFGLITFYIKNAWRVRFSPSTWAKIIKGSYIYVLIGVFAGIYYGADIFLLKFLKGNQTVGTYSAGYKFFDAFMFLAANYSITATPILAKSKSLGKHIFKKRIIRDSALLFTLGVCAVIGVWILGPVILPLILKGSYAVSITILRIVILALPCLLVTTVLLNSLYIYKKQSWVVLLFLFQVCFNIGANIIFIPQYSMFASAYITVIGELINVMAAGVLMAYILKKS